MAPARINASFTRVCPHHLDGVILPAVTIYMSVFPPMLPISSVKVGSIPFPPFVFTEFDMVWWRLKMCLIDLNLIILVTTLGIKDGNPLLQIRNERMKERTTCLRHPTRRCLLESTRSLY